MHRRKCVWIMCVWMQMHFWLHKYKWEHSRTNFKIRMYDADIFLTLDMCTPRSRWTPEHSMHTRTPRFKDAQSGSEAPQSAQVSFPHTFLSTSIGFSCFALNLCCCELLPGRSECPLIKFLSNEESSFKWSKSDELPSELLPLATRWWPLLVGLARRRWN